MAEAHDPARRLKIANTLLALVILVLLGQAAWQAMRISTLRAELDQSRRDLEGKVEALAAEKIKFPREELVATVAWLHDFYGSKEGLQRPGGLVSPDNRPDGEAIGVWVLDVYLQARIEGKSPDEARQLIMDHIRGTEEWRKKHGL